MADEPDMILPLLLEIRAALRDGFARLDRGFAGIDARFDALERLCDDIDGALAASAARRRRETT